VDQPPVPHKFHQSVYDYSKANWDGFLHYLQSQDYTDYLNTSNVKTLWSSLKHLIYQALSMFVPKIIIKAHHHPKWFTSALQHQLNQLHTMKKKGTHPAAPLLTWLGFKLLSRIFNLPPALPNTIMKMT